MGRNTDADWEALAAAEPYWATVALEKYRRENLTEEAIREYYDTGEPHVRLILDTIRARLDPDFSPRRALDFGCGAGRVLVPLAEHCELAVGVDVADGMLAEARARCSALGVENVDLLKGDDSLSCLSGTFDLIHSFIVFQHIPPERGLALVRRLVDRLGDYGVGVLHFDYGEDNQLPLRPDASPASRLRRGVARLARRIGWKRPRVDRSGPAPIRTYEYDLNAVLCVLREAGIRRLHVECTDHAGNYGVLLFFQRVPNAQYVA